MRKARWRTNQKTAFIAGYMGMEVQGEDGQLVPDRHGHEVLLMSEEAVWA